MVHELACSPSGSLAKIDSHEPDFHTAISYVTRVKVGGVAFGTVTPHICSGTL